MGRPHLAAAGLVLTLWLIAGCSSRDDTKGQLNAANTRIAALQTQIAKAVAVTPTPAGSAEFCAGVGEWQTATVAAEKAWDESMAHGTFASTATQVALSDAYRKAWAVAVPAPPSGNDDAIRLFELIVASKSYSEHLLSAGAANAATSLDESATARQKLDAQVKQEAMRLQNDDVTFTISKLLSVVCGVNSTLRGRVR